jgi:hypothetical protein
MPAHRSTSPRVREPGRPGRLLIQERRAAASRERLPQMVPAICPSCLGVIGRAEPGEDRWCRNCCIAVDESLSLDRGIAVEWQ